MTSGLQLKNQLAQLHQRFGVTKDAVVVPMSPPTDGPMVLGGYASTATTDLDRTRFELGSLHWDILPPLLFNHDNEQPAGTIDELRWDAKGLRISATVEHEQARRCNAWSVAAVIEQFEIINGNTPQFFASVTKARLTECSLVTVPFNQQALVTKRQPYTTPAAVTFYDLLIKKVGVLQRLVTVLGQPPAEPPPEPESQTGFGNFGPPAFLTKENNHGQQD